MDRWKDKEGEEEIYGEGESRETEMVVRGKAGGREGEFYTPVV